MIGRHVSAFVHGDATLGCVVAAIRGTRSTLPRARSSLSRGDASLPPARNCPTISGNRRSGPRKPRIDPRNAPIEPRNPMNGPQAPHNWRLNRHGVEDLRALNARLARHAHAHPARRSRRPIHWSQAARLLSSETSAELRSTECYPRRHPRVKIARASSRPPRSPGDHSTRTQVVGCSLGGVTSRGPAALWRQRPAASPPLSMRADNGSA
jgi:hypothetical protein